MKLTDKQIKHLEKTLRYRNKNFDKVKVFPLSNKLEVEKQYKILQWIEYKGILYGTTNLFDVFVEPGRDQWVYRFWLIPDAKFNFILRNRPEYKKHFNFIQIKKQNQGDE